MSCRAIRSTLMRKATVFTIGFRLYGCRSSEYPTGRVHIASCPDRIGPLVPSVKVVHPVLVVWHNQQTYAVSQSGPVGLRQNAVVGRASRPCLVCRCRHFTPISSNGGAGVGAEKARPRVHSRMKHRFPETQEMPSGLLCPGSAARQCGRIGLSRNRA